VFLRYKDALAQRWAFVNNIMMVSALMMTPLKKYSLRLLSAGNACAALQLNELDSGNDYKTHDTCEILGSQNSPLLRQDVASFGNSARSHSGVALDKRSPVEVLILILFPQEK
jgi:hypothetical protein